MAREFLRRTLDDFETVMASEENPKQKHLLRRLVKKVLVHNRDTVEVWYGLPGSDPARIEGKMARRHNKLARPAVLFYRTAMAEKEPSESALLAAYRAGDRTALETLVRRFERPLFAFLLRMTSAADAEDLYQETWVRALRSLDAFDDRKPLSWLFRIARNLTLDRARRTQSRRAWETETRHTANEGGGPSPAEEAAGRDLASHIRRTVSRLPPAQREVFLMRVEGELPFREIARVQGVSINTALARMQYALEKLRAEWRNEWEGGRS